MYAIEFETDINSKTLAIPADVAAEIGQGRHVRIIMLLDERKPAQTDPKSAVKNPTAALLESELIGCAEADPELSRNYKAELGKSLGEKYG